MSAEQFHKTECGIAIPLYATLDENGQPRPPTTGEILAAIYKFAEAYAASSNAQLQKDVQRWRELWAATEDNRAAESALVSTLKGELGEERQAHEKIAEYLLPLVGTGDGTSVDAAKKAADEIESLKGELREALDSNKELVIENERAERKCHREQQ